MPFAGIGALLIRLGGREHLMIPILMTAFATVVAPQGAGIAFTQGIVPRALIFAVCLASGIVHVMRYAHKVKVDPVASLVSDIAEDNRSFFLKSSEAAGAALPTLTRVRSIILALFGLTFGVMIIGVVGFGWWMAEMTGLFLAMSVVVWSVNSW